MPLRELALEYMRTVLETMTWPMVVVFILILYRSQIGSLLEKLKHARLPGGTDLDFEAEHLADKAARESPDFATQDSFAPVASAILDRIRLDPELGLAQLRIELEKSVRAIHELSAAQSDGQRRLGINRLAEQLEASGQLPAYIIGYLKEVILLANRAIHGESVSREAAEGLGGLGVRLLRVLGDIYREKISQPTQTVPITEAECDSLQESRYRVTTEVPLVNDPEINVRILSQDGLDDFLNGYDEFAEFLVALEPLDATLPHEANP